MEFASVITVRDCVRTERGNVDATPVERFCRWQNSSKYVLEMFPETVQTRGYWSNTVALVVILLAFFILTLLFHAISQSRRSEEKRRIAS
ncbi:unnamed protein product [Strongylus vulgaris]|uniref:Uncharacterized protein n=1 Tax=Strongylus vulgaris TaxID=40348 RepID=A0A3P7IHR8_STRVU|nr:unnamed protein product [Strongylus vulgaris]